MAEFHEPNVKLAQLSVPFSTDTVRPSSKVTVSLAVNQQAAPPPKGLALVSILCRAGRSALSAVYVSPP